MFNLMSLLVAAALVSLQCGFVANALLDNKNNLDNTIKTDVASGVRAHSKRRSRHSREFVSIDETLPETIEFTGTPLELQCKVVGKPAPAVQWLKNGEPIPDFQDESNEIQIYHPSIIAWVMSTLIVTAASNGDVFSCVGSTLLHTASASTTIYTKPGDEDLLLPLFTVPTKPVITKYYDQVFQNIGTKLVLPCRVSSPSEPQVYWMDKDGNIIYGNSRLKMLPSGDLLITDVHWNDMGEFVCTAQNLYGKTSISTFLYPTMPSPV